MRQGLPVNYHCEALIYQTVKSHLTLHVYLIPSDKKMIGVSVIEMNKTKDDHVPASQSVLALWKKKIYTSGKV